MRPTVFQKAEIRDENDVIVQQGTYGKGSALSNSTNDGWVDYVMNNLEFLYGLAKDEVVPVSALPASGDMNKTYLLTTNGKTYRWSGTAWVEISSSEAVGRAETAANLAEQWATKTDGTVADNEYSAKHYANAAQQSADDAQDVADDMADHLAQIDQNTGGVSANSKRIGNIEKLLQGNLYDYDTDSSTAYTKSVSAGAMPYASLDLLGGKTVVFNQWADSSTVYSITGNHAFTSGTQFIAGHKYYLNGTLTNGAMFYPYSRNEGVSHTLFPDFLTAPAISTAGFSATSDGTTVQNEGNCWLYVLNNDAGSITDMQIVDLTLLYGAGNEPSTVAEYESDFPAVYSRNTGTLVSAGVTSVVSAGANLLLIASTAGGANGITTTLNTTTQEMHIYGTASGNGDSLFNLSHNIKVKNGRSITVTLQGSGSITGTTTIILRDVNNKYFASSAIAEIRTGVWGKTFTMTEAREIKQILYRVNSTSSINVTVHMQIEYGSTATNYAPYIGTIATYPIPASVQALEGYGWSAGTAYNYVDYERKVFVQNVAKVVLDGNTVAMNDVSSYGSNYRFNTTSHPVSDCKYSGITTNVISSPVISDYMTVIGNPANATENSVFIHSSGEVFLTMVGSAISTVSGVNTWLQSNPITIYYELATPVETDISEYLTDDNLINVEAGGTLTFENQHGDDYQIPVPSEETYMIDLQEAINNG